MIALVRSLPQPLKSLYLLWVVSVVGCMASVVLASTDVQRFAFGLAGAVAVALGVVLLADVRGSAGALAGAVAASTADGSTAAPAWTKTRGYARAFGGASLAVGLIFAVLAVGGA